MLNNIPPLNNTSRTRNFAPQREDQQPDLPSPSDPLFGLRNFVARKKREWTLLSQ